MMNSLKNPAAICKFILFILGFLVVILVSFSRPGRRYQASIEACKTTNLYQSFCDGGEFYKEDFFFAMTIIALIWIIITIIIGLFNTTFGIRIADGVVNIFVGILLLISSALILQSIVSRYNNLTEDYGCSWDRTFRTGVSFAQGHFQQDLESTASKFLVDPDLAQCSIENLLAPCETIKCYAKVVFKYELTISAGAFGLIESILLMAAGIFSFKSYK